MIKVRCSKCGQIIGAPDKYAGKTVSCPKCKAGIQIPQLSGQAEVRPSNVIKFYCPHCNQKIGLAPEYAGRQVRCAKCKNTIRVPQAASVSTPSVPVEKPAGDFNPFDNIPNFDELKQAEQNAPAVDMPLRLTPSDEPTQQSEFANMVGRPSSSSFESAGSGGSSTGFKIDSVLIAMLASIVFVIIGGMFWGLVAKYTEMEFGLLAWGIGGLAGLGIYTFTSNRGVFLGILAALIALFGILSGKYFIAKWYYMPQLMSELRGKNPSDFIDANNIKLSDQQIRQIISNHEQMFKLTAMQLADEGIITKEDAEDTVGAKKIIDMGRHKKDPNEEPNETQSQEKELKLKDVETKVYKYLAEWNEQKKIQVIRAQYPKLVKEFTDAIAKSPVMHAVGFVFAYVHAFSFFDLLWFPIAMVTAYKFGSGAID